MMKAGEIQQRAYMSKMRGIGPVIIDPILKEHDLHHQSQGSYLVAGTIAGYPLHAVNS